MAVTWTPAMTTGHADLDDQHKMLINKLNELLAGMQSGAGDAKLREILVFTGDYAAKHFAQEERLMARVNCPVAEANKKAHADFLKRFGELKAKVAAGGSTALVVIETMKELSTWITTHIRTIDTQLAKM